MKIAYFLNAYPKFANNFIDEEIETLTDLGVEITVFSLEHGQRNIDTSDRGKVKVYCLDEKISIFRMLYSHIFLFLRYPIIYCRLLLEVFARKLSITVFLRYLWVLKKYRVELSSFDLLHAHFIEAQAVLARMGSLIFKKPYTLKIHGSDVYAVRSNSLDFLVRDALCCFVVSNDIANFLKNAYGIDYGNYVKHSCGTKMASCNKIPEEEKSIDVLCVGRMFRGKGIQYLIEATTILVSEFPDIKVFLVGDGYHLDEFKVMISERQLNKNIITTGPVEKAQIYEYYRKAKIFVLPSLQEGLGMVFLEAMSCYLPVIGAKVGGVPEIIVENENGFLVQSHNSEMLAASIRKLLVDPKLRKEMGRSGRQKAEEYELVKQTSELQDIWKGLLCQNKLESHIF